MFKISVLAPMILAVVVMGDPHQKVGLRHTNKTREEFFLQAASNETLAVQSDRQLQSCSTVRCGSTWTNANGKCGTFCTSNAQCTGGELCYASLSSCCATVATSTCSTVRCGSTWTNANGKCGTFCTSNAQCTGGEACFASLASCCSGSAPAPVVTSPQPPTTSKERNRMITFLGNWDRCPTSTEIAPYTHIVVSFAVSYSWTSSGNLCNSDCSIPEPPTCGNAVRKDLISQWKAAGKKVLLSYGGAGMGGSWLPAPNGCWENCYSKGPSVIQRLKELVTNHGYSGVDIDYEYYYDNKNGFIKGTAATNFLTEITSGLKNNLPAGSNTVTHAPMDSDVVKGTAYYNLLKSLAQTGKLDYLLPQYYNGVSFPKTNIAGTLVHYSNLVNDMFGGDATRVVFGFCVAECGQHNTNGAEAATIMTQVGQNFPCNGGAFFWKFLNDMPSNAWSLTVKSAILTLCK